jgi:hypothetical protein
MRNSFKCCIFIEAAGGVGYNGGDEIFLVAQGYDKD